MMIDWRSTTGGSNGSGRYVIDLAQFGAIPLSSGFLSSDADQGYSVQSFGRVGWHDPGTSASTEGFCSFGEDGALRTHFATSGSLYNDWGSDFGNVGTRAQISWDVEVPIQ